MSLYASPTTPLGSRLHRASPGGVSPSVPLKTPSNAHQKVNSELGVSAVGFNLVHVSSTHPPSLMGHWAHFK